VAIRFAGTAGVKCAGQTRMRTMENAWLAEDRPILPARPELQSISDALRYARAILMRVPSGTTMTNRANFAGFASFVLFACNRAPATPSGDGPNGDDKCEVGCDLEGCNENVTMTVSDTGFRLGPADAGSGAANIEIPFSSCSIALTLTNVGTRPHDLVVGCAPSGLPAGCVQTSCFPDPDDAGSFYATFVSSAGPVTLVPPVEPGSSTTAMFDAPVLGGTYPFISNEPGDDTQFAVDGGVTGALAGMFVLE
jgi:hypothetical protein